MCCSDQIPYLEVGDYVAYNNDKQGFIECLKRDVGLVDLDDGLSSLPDWIPIKAMLTTWLADALSYELWVGCEEGSSSPAYTIYYSDLPWPIRKVLFWKKARWIKLKHGITNENAVVKNEEVSFSSYLLPVQFFLFMFFVVFFSLIWYLCLAISDGQIYGRANSAYDALSNWLGEQNYLFEDR